MCLFANADMRDGRDGGERERLEMFACSLVFGLRQCICESTLACDASSEAAEIK